jgi:hypothetical protein
MQQATGNIQQATGNRQQVTAHWLVIFQMNYSGIIPLISGKMD